MAFVEDWLEICPQLDSRVVKCVPGSTQGHNDHARSYDSFHEAFGKQDKCLIRAGM